jgi:AraC family transcriptional regulator
VVGRIVIVNWKINLLRYHYVKQREQFSLAEDTYKGWSLLAAESGRFSFSIDGDEQADQIAKFGEFVICPPGHRLRRHALEPISFHFAEFTLAGHRPQSGKVRINDVGRLSSTFRYLQSCHEEKYKEDTHTEEVEHLLVDLFMLANRERLAAERNSYAITDPLMNQAASLIETHVFEHDLNLQQLAVTLGIGASQLTRRFQAAFGLSPIKYATKFRISRARQLLAETTDTLDAIAEQCGFQNAFYFSRVFSKHMKISPSAYRRTFRV